MKIKIKYILFKNETIEVTKALSTTCKMSIEVGGESVETEMNVEETERVISALQNQLNRMKS